MQFNSKTLDYACIGLLEFSDSGIIVSMNDTAVSCLSSGNATPPVNIFDISDVYKSCFSDLNVGSQFDIHLKDETIFLKNTIIEKTEKAVTVLIKDITSEKIFMKQLYEVEEKMRTMLDVIPDIVYRVDKTGKIEFISEAITRYGYTQEELIGTSLLELVHPEDHEKAKRRILERRTGERMTKFYELRMLTKNKEVINVEFNEDDNYNSMFFSVCARGVYRDKDRDEKIFIGTQGIYHDINERKQYESALRKSEEKWVMVMETIKDGYFETDLNGRILYVNRALCEKMGYQKEEIIGTFFDRYVEEKQKEKILSYFKNFTENENKKAFHDWRILNRDGEILTFQSSISIIKTSRKGDVFYNGILRDVSEKKKIEQELLMARKLEAIGILAGGIAHDYNNALTAIIGNLSLAKMDIKDDSGDLLETIVDAEKAALRVKELTQQLSTFSKGGKPVKKNISIKPVIIHAAENILEDSDATYSLDFSDDLWNVEIDEFQVGHVLEYIISNAVESMPEGGLVEIKTKNVEVDSTRSHHEISLQPGRYVVIQVRDEGCGIDNDNLVKIFDPYFSTKEMASGMGLAISYAIIKRHRGFIDVHSKPGNGTSFYIYLPVIS